MIVIGNGLDSDPVARERLHGIAEMMIHVGQVDAGISLLAKLTEVFPKDLAIIKALGGALNDAGRHEEALQCARVLVKLDSNTSFSWLTLGFEAIACEKFLEARHALDQAIGTKPEDEVSLKTLADLAMCLNYRLPAAEDAIRQVIEKESPRQTNLYVLGVVLKMQGKIGEGQRVFEQLVQLDPDSVLGVAASALAANPGANPSSDFSKN